MAKGKKSNGIVDNEGITYEVYGDDASGMSEIGQQILLNRIFKKHNDDDGG